MYPTLIRTSGLLRFIHDLDAERTQQLARFGEQRHPDGTGRIGYAQKATIARSACQTSAVVEEGGPRWSLILLEEVYEALAETAPARLRAELVQVAAVCAAWVRDIDRRPPVTPDVEAVATSAAKLKAFFATDSPIVWQAAAEWQAATAYETALAEVDHTNQPAERPCPLCPAVKPSAYALRDHVLNVHPDQFEAWRDTPAPVPAGQCTAHPVPAPAQERPNAVTPEEGNAEACKTIEHVPRANDVVSLHTHHLVLSVTNDARDQAVAAIARVRAWCDDLDASIRLQHGDPHAEHPHAVALRLLLDPQGGGQ